MPTILTTRVEGCILHIENVGFEDMSKWVLLSKEYDNYVREAALDLTEWYEGSDTSFSFDEYMGRRIHKKEAFMAANELGECCGIIAISRENNNITFFGTFHKFDTLSVGDFLIRYALSELDESKRIKINELKSNSRQIKKNYALLDKFGFIYQGEVLENGVLVNCMVKNP